MADHTRKHAMITGEQEAMLRALEQAKKIGYGEFTLFIQAGNITRYEITKSHSFFGDTAKSERRQNSEVLKEAEDDLKDFEIIAI